MQDADGPAEVEVIDMERAFDDRAWLTDRFAGFLDSLDQVERHPRRWVLEHAQLDVARTSWARVIEDWRARAGDRPAR